MSCRLTRGLLLASIAVVVLGASAGAARAQEEPRVEWQPHWRKMQPVEYVVTGVLGVSAILIEYLVPTQSSGPYGGVLFDDGVRDLLRAETRAGRDTAKVIADIGYKTLFFLPYIDVAVTWAIHGNEEVAWQMLMLNLEAHAVAGFLGIASNHFIPRARPSVEPCKQDPSYEAYCSSPGYNSFMSGHSLIAAAGAGVTCAHHLSMPLYGGGAGDIAMCAVTSAAALTVGIGRIVNDRHWATDVLTGWLLGVATGYLWPKLFHYRSAPDSGERAYAILPAVTPDAYTVQLIVLD